MSLSVHSKCKYASSHGLSIFCCDFRGIFDKNRIAKMKKGVLVVNNARGAIMDTQAVADACSSGHIAGYSGDVWYPQPAPKDHPWQYMPNQAMTPHISGTTIDAQLRYAGGTNDMLDRYFKGEEFPAQNYIVKDGQLARCCVVGGALLRMSVINRPLSTMSFRTLAM